MAEDVHLKRYANNAKKPLTSPAAVLQGPPPNPAMLNPDMDDEKRRDSGHHPDVVRSHRPAPQGLATRGSIESV